MVSISDITELDLDAIRIDGGTQPRAEISTETVNDYAASFAAGADFPPVDVFFDGKEYWLADGFHRWHGATNASMQTLAAKVHNGTRRDAVLFAVGCNSTHGLKRTNEDKRQAVLMLLNDEEWVQWSDRSIAEKCGVSNPFVSSIRKTLLTVNGVSEPTERKFTTSTGKTATIKVASPEASEPEPAPVVEKWAEDDEPPVAPITSAVSPPKPKSESADQLAALKRAWQASSAETKNVFTAWIVLHP